MQPVEAHTSPAMGSSPQSSPSTPTPGPAVEARTGGADRAEAEGRSQLGEFLQRDYELKVNFLAEHYSRMWVRFNFFIATHTALSAALFGWFKDDRAFSANARPVAVLGAVAAAVWYCFGAQDRYLVAVYRAQVLIVGRQLARVLKLQEHLKSLGPLDRPSDVSESDWKEACEAYLVVSDVEQPRVQSTVYQWRLGGFSTTKLVAWFPLLVAAYWLVLASALSFGITTAGPSPHPRSGSADTAQAKR